MSGKEVRKFILEHLRTSRLILKVRLLLAFSLYQSSISLFDERYPIENRPPLWKSGPFKLLLMALIVILL